MGGGGWRPGDAWGGRLRRRRPVPFCMELSSSSKWRMPICSFLSIRSRHSWLSTNSMYDHSMPSASYSACSDLKTSLRRAGVAPPPDHK